MVERFQKSDLNVRQMEKLYSVSLLSSVKKCNYIELLPHMSGNHRRCRGVEVIRKILRAHDRQGALPPLKEKIKIITDI